MTEAAHQDFLAKHTGRLSTPLEATIRERHERWPKSQRMPQRTEGSTEDEGKTKLTDLWHTKHKAKAWDADAEREKWACSVCQAPIRSTWREDSELLFPGSPTISSTSRKAIVAWLRRNDQII